MGSSSLPTVDSDNLLFPETVEKPAPFVPQPVTSNETELEDEDPATAGPKRLAPLGLNK